MRASKRLMLLCEEYQDLASRNLFREEQLNGPVNMVGPTVHFLFPNVSDPERQLLKGLLHARMGCLITMRPLAPHQAKKMRLATQGKAELERYAKLAEERFMSVKRAVEDSGLMEKLTRVQVEILKKEFFTVPL